MQQLLLDLSPPPPTLANFAVGRNAEALSALHAWLLGTLREHCIYLWGPPGCGKTHVLRALVEAAQQRVRSSVYVEPHALEALETIMDLPRFIALDDAERMTDAQQAALFRLFQRVTEDDILLLVSAAAAPAALSLRDDLRTRLASGLTFQMHLLSDEDKAEALRGHAAGRGFELAPEIAQYLLRRRQRDLPSLMQVLDALDQYSLRSQRPITLALLREMLQPANLSTSRQP
jgi:DnaA family protein